MKIPDRWLDYCKIGMRITGTPFISFKTPLYQPFNGRPECSPQQDNLQDDEKFTPTDVCEEIAKQKHSLKVVIDLTNTFKYYNGQQEFAKRNGVYYEKIKCEGQQIPNDMVFHRFSTIVNNFLLRHGCAGEEVIGVHCTHGLNRTGYLICRYMIDWLGFQPKQAIDAFNDARGHSMERQNYLKDLSSRLAANRFDDLRQGLPINNGCPPQSRDKWNDQSRAPPMMDRGFPDQSRAEQHRNNFWHAQQYGRDFRRDRDYRDDRPGYNRHEGFRTRTRPPPDRRNGQHFSRRDKYRTDSRDGFADRGQPYPSKWRTNQY